MKGLIIPLFEIVDIQKDQIKLYEKQINLLEKQKEFLLTKIKELNVELYKQLTEAGAIIASGNSLELSLDAKSVLISIDENRIKDKDKVALC